MQIPNVMQHLRVFGGSGGSESAVVRRIKKLANFLVRRHTAQRVFNPLPRSRRKWAQSARGLRSRSAFQLFCRDGAALTAKFCGHKQGKWKHKQAQRSEEHTSELQSRF